MSIISYPIGVCTLMPGGQASQGERPWCILVCIAYVVSQYPPLSALVNYLLQKIPVTQRCQLLLVFTRIPGLFLCHVKCFLYAWHPSFVRHDYRTSWIATAARVPLLKLVLRRPEFPAPAAAMRWRTTRTMPLHALLAFELMSTTPCQAGGGDI